ncbi:MAG: ABC transporter permease [Rhodobacteraceae bacterium]|nr:ABC transporter permease [Paracoccaceae bacterium]
MFEVRRHRTTLGGIWVTAEVLFHTTVHSIRSKHNNAFVAVALSLLQVVVFVLAFYVMFHLLQLRGAAIRGDFLLYVLSGIFLYLLHIKAIGAVAGAEGLNSPMMLHSRMNSFIMILSAALGVLYIKALTLVVILFGYHVIFTPVYIYDPIGAIGMVLLAWFTGMAIGLLFLVAKPWAPDVIGIARTVYQRANMIASGKMFLANTLPSYMLVMFDWNPLFHCIDQSRGFVFINYNPHFSSWEYAFWLAVIMIVIGMMGEFFTRRRMSASWSARR